MAQKYRFLDTTLRDGEQTPGVSLIPEDKLLIAQKLDALGVDVIEAGSAPISEGERKAIKMIARAGLKAEICSFVRAVKSDVDFALKCDVDSVHLVVPVSDLHIKHKLKKSRGEVARTSIEVAEYAKKHGLLVEFSAEDASRADFEFVKDMYASAKKVAKRICFCDTVGVLTPDKTKEIFSSLQKLDIPASFHGHDDFGLATANSVAALLSGASQVHVTINGIGERAGNASLEEVVMALETLHGIRTGISKKELYPLSRLVARLTKVHVAPNKAIVGDNAFSHESGIHIHGIAKNAMTYEPIPPEIVGRTRRFVFGKHTGRTSVELALKEMKLKASAEQTDEILRRVKALGDKGLKVTDADLQSIAEAVMQIPKTPKVKLMDFAVVSGKQITPTASVKLNINGNDVLEAGTGVGPVDAAIGAVKRAMEGVEDIELVEYHVDAITGGTNAVVEVIVKLAKGDKVITSKGVREDIILASVEAVVEGINRLI
jgi:D-citramalate synthase